MKICDLNHEYDRLQEKYGSRELSSIYNGGMEENPDICFVFMNPTGRNIASFREWKGRRFPWIGTKNIWKLFYQIGLLEEEIYQKIQSKKPKEWDPEFAEEVYRDVANHGYFITNLGKCTQVDARPLPDRIYQEYLDLLYREIDLLQPKKIVTFGNQVSSVFLEQPISVSQCRKQRFTKTIAGNTYDVYPVFYPVGNGIFNIDKAIEDLTFILNQKDSVKS